MSSPLWAGGNMIENVSGERIGADAHYWTIEALKYIRDCDSIPKNNREFTEHDYNLAKKYIKSGGESVFPDGLIGFAGFSYSFGSIFYSAWARDKRDCDYVSAAFCHALKQKPKLTDTFIIQRFRSARQVNYLLRSTLYENTWIRCGI